MEEGAAGITAASSIFMSEEPFSFGSENHNLTENQIAWLLIAVVKELGGVIRVNKANFGMLTPGEHVEIEDYGDELVILHKRWGDDPGFEKMWKDAITSTKDIITELEIGQTFNEDTGS